MDSETSLATWIPRLQCQLGDLVLSEKHRVLPQTNPETVVDVVFFKIAFAGQYAGLEATGTDRGKRPRRLRVVRITSRGVVSRLSDRAIALLGPCDYEIEHR